MHLEKGVNLVKGIQCIRDTVVSSSSGMIQTSLMAEKTLSTVPTLASQVPMVSWLKKISSYPSSSFLFIVSQFLSTILHHDKKSFKQSILQLMLRPSHSSRFFPNNLDVLRWNVAVMLAMAIHSHVSGLRHCPGRQQSCHAPTVEYAPLKMVAVPSWVVRLESCEPTKKHCWHSIILVG